MMLQKSKIESLVREALGNRRPPADKSPQDREAIVVKIVGLLQGRQPGQDAGAWVRGAIAKAQALQGGYSWPSLKHFEEAAGQQAAELATVRETSAKLEGVSGRYAAFVRGVKSGDTVPAHHLFQEGLAGRALRDGDLSLSDLRPYQVAHAKELKKLYKDGARRFLLGYGCAPELADELLGLSRGAGHRDVTGAAG